MTKLQDLLVRAKEAYDVAAHIETGSVSGIAIRMKSGLILTGYSRSVPEGDAAQDALRSAILCFPESGKQTPKKIMDHFTIAAVALINATGKIGATGVTMRILEKYPAIENDAHIYVAKNPTEEGEVPRVSTVKPITPSL